MQWQKKSRPHKTQWHQWFAWHPVTIDGTTYWLEHVYRRGRIELAWNHAGIQWEWEYATSVFDLLSQTESDSKDTQSGSGYPKPPMPLRRIVK
jgi:hypothetical protein